MKKLVLLLMLIFTSLIAKESIQNKDSFVALMPQNFPPYFVLDENNKPSGFAVELFKEVSRRSNLDFKIIVKPNYFEVEKAFLNKEADVIIASGISEKRKENSIFTHKFDSSGIKAYKLETTNINSLDEIKFHKLSLKTNHVTESIFKDFPKEQIMMVSNKEEGLLSLLSKESDVFIYNERPFHKLLSSLKLDKTIEPLDTVIRKVDLAIRVQKDKKNLQKKLNIALEEFTSTREFQNLKNEWISPQDDSINNGILLTLEEKEYLKNKKVLTLGFHLKWEPYLIEKAPSEYIGIIPDYYNLIADRLGVKFKYKIYDNINKTLELSKKNSVDIIPIMSESVAKENGFESSKSFFINHTYIFINKENNLDKIDSIKDLKGLKVAYANTRIRLNNYLSQFKDKMKLVKTNSSLEAFLLLKNREVDVVIDKYTSNYLLAQNLLDKEIKPVYLLKEFIPDSITAISSDVVLLKSIMTKAISSITFLEQQYIIDKWLKLHDFSEEKKLQLSFDEIKYLSENKEFTVCNQYNNYPTTGVKDNKLIGIMGEFYRHFEKDLNIKFKAIDSKSRQDLNEKVKNEKCDFVSLIVKGQKRFTNIISSDILWKTHFVSMGNLKSVYINNLALANEYTFLVRYESIKKNIHKIYPNLNVIVVKDDNEIIKKVQNNSKFYLIDSKTIIDKNINKYGFDKFKINGIFENIYAELSVGVNENNPIMLGIINKTIKNLDDSYIDSTINKYSIKEFTIKKNYNIYLIYLLVILSIIIFFIYFRSVLLLDKLKLQKELDEIKERQLRQDIIKKERDILNKAEHIAKVGSFTYETNTNKFWCSIEYCTIMDFALNEEVTIEKEFSRIHLKDKNRVKEFITNIQRTRGEGVIKYKIINKDSIKCIERHFSYDNLNQVYTGVILDITEKVLEEKEKKQRELTLLNQSKLASLGEMIGNIAHQWRQPLSVISVASSGIKLQNEMKILNDDILNKELDLINKNCMFLSNTIETFRNFISTSKDKDLVVIQKVIKDTISILDSSLKNDYIKLIHNLNESIPIKMMLVSGELNQVIMSIITNAKDILLEKKIENPLIELTLEKNKNTIKIVIKDNGGFIPEDILPFIFDPYFTTKHKSQGTGLGLYLAYQIVTEQLNGCLEVKNITFKYENTEYLGKEFIITLDLTEDFA